MGLSASATSKTWFSSVMPTGNYIMIEIFCVVCRNLLESTYLKILTFYQSPVETPSYAVEICSKFLCYNGS